MLDVQGVNADLWVVDVHLDVPIFVEVLLGHDAEVVVTIFDVVLLLDVVGFDEPIFVVVLFDEVDVVNGLDVVDFPTVLDVQGMVGDVLCILLYDDL